MEPMVLHALHASHGAQFEAAGDREAVRSFGSWRDEYRAAREGVVLRDLSAREWIRLTGEDRITFLHGMVTNDVKGLADQRTAYAAMLTSKGAMVSDARILRRPQDLLLDVEPGLGKKVETFLQEHLISEDVELNAPPSDLSLLGLYGPKASALVSMPEVHEVRSISLGGCEVLAVRADRVLPGVELAVKTAELEKVYAFLFEQGAKPIGEEAWTVLRVEAGVPVYGADMDEKTIPLEAGLESAIHYNKGCYIGQEVIARATFRGHVNRKLSGLLLGELSPASHAELKKGERKAGWITTVVESPVKGQRVALGYVHRDFAEAGTVLELASGGTATVQPLPLK